MISGVSSRPENGAIVATDSRPTSTQSDHTREPMERDLAKVSYFSPVTRIDVDTQKAVLQYRDADTGNVERQYPSKERLRAYSAGGSAMAADQPAETARDEAKPSATRESLPLVA